MSDETAGRLTAGARMTRARWRLAEERLYPLALADAGAYQEAVRRVGAVLTVLRADCHTLDELLGVDDDPAEALSAAAPGDPDSMIDARTVLDAACALRLAELAAQGRVPAE